MPGVLGLELGVLVFSLVMGDFLVLWAIWPTFIVKTKFSDLAILLAACVA